MRALCSKTTFSYFSCFGLPIDFPVLDIYKCPNPVFSFETENMLFLKIFLLPTYFYFIYNISIIGITLMKGDLNRLYSFA